MTTIAFANQKGGVGKTTLTVHMAAFLAQAGRRVIVVDADPQGNATSWLTDGDTTRDDFFQCLVVGRPALTLARVVEGWNLRLLGGNYRTGEAFIFDVATGKPFNTIAEYLRPLTTEADYVLVDMPPSKGAGFRETLFACDWVIVPTQLERLSLEGVAFMAQTAEELKRDHGRGPRLLAVVPNMTRRVTTEHKGHMADLVAHFGPAVWPPIPLSVKVAEACSYGKSLFDYAPRETVTQALRTVGDRLLTNLERAKR